MAKPVLEVPCKWCSNPTRMTGTKECNNCWEMRSRMQSNMVVARRILTTLEIIKKKEENARIIDQYKDAVDDAGKDAPQSKINERMGV